MNLRFTTTLVTVACVLLASCYPYNENPKKKIDPKSLQKAVVGSEQKKVKEGGDRIKTAATTKKKELLPEIEEPSMTSGTDEPKKQAIAAVRKEVPVAVKVPGKEGYVLSPFNNKLIDVTGMASGSLAADPTYPASEKKHFRVP